MPRRMLVLALALTLAVAGVAYAVNTYTINKSSTAPAGVGSSAKPLKKRVVFSFSTSTTDGTRAKVIRFYDIGLQGLRSYSARVPRCTYTQANQKSLAAVQSACRKAATGSGTVNNFFGPSNDPNAKTQCKLALRLYNIRNGKYGGLAIRLDRAQPGDCAVNPATAIKAKFRKTRIRGRESSNLRFEVGQNLRHPIPGFDNSVNNVTATVLAKLRRRVTIAGRRREVTVLNSVACGKNNRRLTSVKFTDETGASATVRKTAKC